jgi:hypothetical protein
MAAIWRKVMKSRSAAAFALLAGFAVGAVAVQGLHAAARAPVYVVTEVDITDLDAYQKDYVPVVQASIKASGGRLIPRSGSGMAQFSAVQGRAEDRR